MKLSPQEIVAGKEVVILGVCRNVSQEVEGDVHRLISAFQDFSQVHFRVVESDSSDSTATILENLAQEIKNFQFVSLGDLKNQISERVARITYCRNFYLQILRDDFALKNCSYVVVTDLDGVNTHLSRSAVLSCWERDGWDACMANQAAPYYDIYALRHPIWSPNDCWHYEAKLRKEGTNPVAARNKAIYSRMISIAPQDDWIPVDSAFGGLAIYKRHLFENVQYGSVLPNGDHVCEHVTLHQQMRERGAKLFINPALINMGWNVHNTAKRPTKKIKNFIKLILWKMVPFLRKDLF